MSSNQSQIIQEISLLRKRLQSLQVALTEPNPSQTHMSQTLSDCYRHLDQLESSAKQLCASKLTLDDILSTANAAITSVLIFEDLNWEYDYHSTNVEAVFGFSPAELNVDKSLWLSRIDPQDLETVILPSFDIIFAGQTTSRKYRFLHKDETWRWITDTLISRRNEAKNCWRLTLVATDITPLITQEEALQASEKQFRTLVENVPGAVYRCDPITWEDFYTSDAIESIIGYSAADVMQRVNYVSLIHPEDIERVRRSVDEAIAVRQSYNIDYRVFHKDGSVKWINEIGRGVWNDRDELLYLDGIVFDVTERKQTEIALRTSEEYYRLLAEAQPHFLWTGTSDGSAQYCNRCWHDYTGLALEESAPYSWLHPIHPHDTQRVLELWENALVDGNSYTVEYRVRRASDNTYRWFYEQVSPVRDESGNIQVWFGTAVDIHDRKQAEDALRESEERFRQLAENIGQVFCMVVADTRELIYISPACEAVWGYKQHEFYDRDRAIWFNSIHPDDLHLIVAKAAKNQEGETTQFTYRITRADGEARCIEARYFPVCNEAGQVYRVIGISEDITERKKAEEALQESEARFRQLTESIREVFFIETADFEETLYVSPGFSDIWGYSYEQLYQTPQAWIDVVHPDDRPSVIASLHPQDNTQPTVKEYRIIRPDGSVRWIFSRTFPIFDDTGTVIRQVGVSEDVTDRKQAEEQLKASLREKEVLLSEVHHRVKNNLQLISSMLDLQAMRIDDPCTYQALQDSQNRIRAIAKVHESLYQANNFAEINLSNYIQSLATDLFNTYSMNRTISLRIDIPEGLAINLDKAIPCGLILNELISNALKHGFQSSRTGQVYVTLRADSSHHLILSVGNTGDTLPANFDLVQVRSLGLQLVSALVEQLEGTFHVCRGDRTLFEVRFEI